MQDTILPNLAAIYMQRNAEQWASRRGDPDQISCYRFDKIDLNDVIDV